MQVITRNTLLYNLAFIVINTVVGIILAIFICDVVSKKLKNFIKVRYCSLSDVNCNY